MRHQKLSDIAPVVAIVIGLIAACCFVVRASISPVGSQSLASSGTSSPPAANSPSISAPFSTTAAPPSTTSAEAPATSSSAASSSSTAPASSAAAEDPGAAADPSATAGTGTPAGGGATTSPGTMPYGYQHPQGWAGNGQVVSLTFDDGPGPQTSKVLDILDKYGIKATFCMIGQQVSSYPSVVQRIVNSGDQLCNHSYSHNEKMDTWTPPQINAEMQKASAAITKYAGVGPTFFRTPGGSFTQSIKDACFANKLTPLSWAVDTKDWTKPGVQAIVNNALSAVTPGAIILMHDAGGDRSQTLTALPTIISTLQSRGYTFTTPATA